MKKTFAGLGVLALVTLGVTGASFPAMADAVQPVTEIVAESDAIVAAPDVVLAQSEPVVTTTAAEVPAEPVAVVTEPVVVPVAPVEPVAVPEPVAIVADAPVSTEPVVEAPETPVVPEVVAETPEPVADYVVLPDGSRRSNFQGAAEAFALFIELDSIKALTPDEQMLHFTQFRGTYKIGYAPAGHLLIPSVVNASEVHAFDTTATVPTEAY